MERKLILRSVDKASYLQIIGFVVILLGLAYLIIQQLLGNLNAEVMSIDFFTIMLGIIFAFPDLLKDANKGLSTVRIVVFMVVNVFCLLALKLGWDAKSLKDIGVDKYWMGIVALTFGAKAIQSYFESKITGAKTLQANGAAHVADADDMDSCGALQNLTTGASLPQSKGGMV